MPFVCFESLTQTSFLFSSVRKRLRVFLRYEPRDRDCGLSAEAWEKSELLELVRSRAPTFRREGLATDRAPIMMCARRDDHRSFGMEVAGSNRRRAQESERARGVE